MYTIEEYGKAYLLKSYLTAAKGHFLIPVSIFGKGPKWRDSHRRKLEEAFKNLPQECKKLSNSILIFDRPPKTFWHTVKTWDWRSISFIVPADCTTMSTQQIHPTRELEFDLKTGCFYIDRDENKREPQFIMAVDKDQLNHTIRSMRRVVADFHI